MSDISAHESGVLNQEKLAGVDTIVARDKLAFDSWINETSPDKKFGMPHDALRYAIIPRRVLEIVDDPSKVDVLERRQNENLIEALVVVRQQEPVTNIQSLQQHLARIQSEQKIEETNARAEGRRPIYLYPEAPLDVDPYHVEYARLINEGKLSVYDLVTNEVSIYKSLGDCMYVGNYGDRKELQGKGVAKSFYQRLHEVAKAIGFRYITGANNEKNIGFFTNTLGRISLSDIVAHLKKTFNADHEESTQETFTIDFLYPEDKEKFLEKRETINN